MPVESGKEVVKLAVESSGSGWIQWTAGGIGGGVAWVWAHITGRLKKIEQTMVTAAFLKEHVDDENQKFKELFTKHDGIIDKVSDIQASVARIEGAISHDNRRK